MTLLALMMLSVSSCARSGPAKGLDYCALAKPIWFVDEDKVTQETENAIIAHNEQWEKHCSAGVLFR
jgi:hypothetical protein